MQLQDSGASAATFHNGVTSAVMQIRYAVRLAGLQRLPKYVMRLRDIFDFQLERSDS